MEQKKAVNSSGFFIFIMKLAESSHRKIEEFYREFLDEKDFKLPVIHFYAGKFTHTFTKLLSVNGITFGRRIFIFPQFISLNQNQNPKLPELLVVHEIAHVLQYRREGFIKFFYKYFGDYWKNLRKKKKWNQLARQQAYFEIPFEVEARKAADKYLEWKEKNQEKNKT